MRLSAAESHFGLASLPIFNRSRSACWILHLQKFSGLFLESNVR